MAPPHEGAIAWIAAASPAPKQQTMLDRLLNERYSCRSFDPSRAVAPHLLELTLESATLAPSACNLQPYHFEVVTGATMTAVAALRNFYGARALIIGTFDAHNTGYVSAQGQEFRLFDLGLALMAAALKATELGLASCFIGSLPIKELKAELKLSSEPVIALALGYAAPDAAPSDNHFKRRRGSELYTLHE